MRSFAISNCEDNGLLRINCDGTIPGGGIYEIVNIILSSLTAVIVITAILVIVAVLLRYSQTRDKKKIAASAKKIIIRILTALAVWLIFYALIYWLMPRSA
jgi:uncharacterized membrane protein